MTERTTKRETDPTTTNRTDERTSEQGSEHHAPLNRTVHAPEATVHGYDLA